MNEGCGHYQLSSSKAREKQAERGGNVIVSSKKYTSGLSLPVFCWRQVGFLGSGLGRPLLLAPAERPGQADSALAPL